MAAPQADSFGQMLRRYRLAAEYTQEALAQRAGLSIRSVSDLERGVSHYPHPHTIEALADALHLTGPVRASFAAAAQRRNNSFFVAQREPRVGGTSSSPFVGRAREVATYRRFLAGEGPPLLLFSGEPGIGKSRLLREMMIQARGDGWRTLAGGCDQRSGRDPYAPFASMLAESLLAIPATRRKADLKDCRWLARLAPELAEIAPTPVSEWSLTPSQERRLVFAATRRYLTNVAGPAGTLLVLDDLQWAGADALDLFAFLIQTAATEPSQQETALATPAPLRLVGAYRTSDVQGGHPLEELIVRLAHDERVTLRQVDRLTEEEARSLATNLIGDVSDADQKVADIVARADRVPFYLVNFAQALRPGVEVAPLAIDTDSLVREQKTPWLVTATIRQRITSLPSEAQEALAVAAIIGRVAPLATLRLALKCPEDDLTTSLEIACRAQLLEEAGCDPITYRFTHDLIRETLLDSLGQARQALVHRNVADALEQLPASERARQAAALADHLTKAGELARALPYALQAGDQAEAAFAHTEASAHFRAAILYAEAADDLPHKAEALEKLGVSLLRLGHTDPALAALEAAAQLYTELNDIESRYRALAALIQTHWQRGTAEEGLVKVRPILAAHEEQGETPASPALAALYKSICVAHRLDSQHEERARAAKRLEQFARTLHDDALLFAALQYQIYTAFLSGESDTTLREYLNLTPLAERIGDPVTLLELDNNIAATYLQQGEFSLSLAYNEKALKQAQRTGGPHHITRMLINRAELHYYRGAWAEAEADVSQADAIADNSNQFGVTYSLLYRVHSRGALEMAQGNEKLARRYLEQVFEGSLESHDLQALAYSRQFLAELDLLGGRATEVHASLSPVLDQLHAVPIWAEGTRTYMAWALLNMSREEEAAHEIETCIAGMRVRATRLWLVDALRVRAMLAIQGGHWEAAKADLDEAIALAGAMPYPYAVLKALYVYGQLHEAMDQPLRARASYEQALVICRELGEGLYRSHVERALDVARKEE